MSDLCAVDGCEAVVYSKRNGLCHVHWHADRRYQGSGVWQGEAPFLAYEPTEETSIPAEIRDAFWSNDLDAIEGETMGRQTVLVDDLDGSLLPTDAQPIRLSLGRTTYNLYLSEENHGKLMEAIGPFIENAETVTGQAPKAAAASSSSAEKEKLKAVREWAQATKYTYTNAKGEETTLGDRGRIPQEVIDAYDKAH